MDDVLVRAGRSASLRDQPNELTESRNEVVAMTLESTQSFCLVNFCHLPRMMVRREGIPLQIVTTRKVSVSQTAEEAAVDFQAKEKPAGTMHDGNQYVRADDLQESRMGVCECNAATERRKIK